MEIHHSYKKNALSRKLKVYLKWRPSYSDRLETKCSRQWKNCIKSFFSLKLNNFLKNCYADTSSWTNIECLCGLFDIFEVGFMGMFLFKFYENFMKLCDPLSISSSFKPSFFWNPNNRPTPFQFKPLIQSPQSQKRQRPQFKILEFLSRAITYENVSYQIPYLECPFYILFYFSWFFFHFPLPF